MEKQLKMKRNLNIRKQSRIATPKENLWYFSEDSAMNQSPITEKKSFMNDRASIFNDDYTRYSQGNSVFSKSKKKCSFVVDWQMTDAF